jgi:hypothetical protein
VRVLTPLLAALTVACAPSEVPGACISDEVSTWYADLDGDGFGDRRDPEWDYCPNHPSRIAQGGDCDDRDPKVRPGVEERWYDGVDQDCDGWSDHDQDRDGHDALSAGGQDCDDLDPATFPEAPEVWYDEVDQGCDGGDDHDQDGDGDPAPSGGGEDCDDADPTSFPGAPELPDQADNDCNGVVDDVTLVLTTRQDFAHGAFDGATAPGDDGDGSVSTVPDGGALWPLVWTTPMPLAMSSVGMTATRDAVYILGGASGNGSTGGEIIVARAPILPGGLLDAWELLNPLPDPSASHTTVTDGHCMVVIAGTSPATGAVGRTLSAVILPDGTLDYWVEHAAYPLPVAQSRGVYLRGWIYVTGGTQDGTSTAAVYRARLDADCTIDAWVPDRSLPTPMSYHNVLTENGHLYLLGGTTNGVWRGTPGEDGGIPAWESQPSLPGVLWASAGAVLGGHLVLFGGDYDGETTALIHRAPLLPGGEVGAWTVAEQALPEPRRLETATVWDERAYVVGGWTGSDSVSVVRTDTVAVTGLDARAATSWRPGAVYQTRFDLTQTRPLVELDWTVAGSVEAGVTWWVRTADDSADLSPWVVLGSQAPLRLNGQARYVDLVAELRDPTGQQVVLERVEVAHR